MFVIKILSPVWGSGRARAQDLGFHFPPVEVPVAAAGCADEFTAGSLLAARHELPTPINSMPSNACSVILLALSIPHTPHCQRWISWSSWRLISPQHNLPVPHSTKSQFFSTFFFSKPSKKTAVVLQLFHRPRIRSWHRREGQRDRGIWGKWETRSEFVLAYPNPRMRIYSL